VRLIVSSVSGLHIELEGMVSINAAQETLLVESITKLLKSDWKSLDGWGGGHWGCNCIFEVRLWSEAINEPGDRMRRAIPSLEDRDAFPDGWVRLGAGIHTLWAVVFSAHGGLICSYFCVFL
jgi:hypothetical protein